MSEHAVQASGYAVVMRALAGLGRTERTALQLIYWQDRTQEQVAVELQVPLATVRVAVRRGMQQLAARIVEQSAARG